MPEKNKKPLTNGGNSPKINPDAFWNCIKRKAKEKGHARMLIEFIVHNGEIRGAELVSCREKLSPYVDG